MTCSISLVYPVISSSRSRTDRRTRRCAGSGGDAGATSDISEEKKASLSSSPRRRFSRHSSGHKHQMSIAGT